MHSPLLFESQISSALERGFFDLNASHPVYRKNIATLIKLSWASSPLALLEMLARVVDTPDGEKEFNFAERKSSEFVVSRRERRRVLNPLIEQLTELNFLNDPKIQNLLYIVNQFCPGEKAIVFCERKATVYYLEQALQHLLPELRVYSTVEAPRPVKGVNSYDLKKTKDIQKAIALFAPVANDAEGRSEETYDVFISTDAFGVGVNMQDACVVVNYDIAWTPIEPTQRAGRILRFWKEPRKLYVYTLVPTLSAQNALNYELSHKTERWKNLIARHSVSRQLIDLPVLIQQIYQHITLEEWADPNDSLVIESGSLALGNEEEDRWVSSYYLHTRKLHSYRSYVENLENDLVSALIYKGQKVMLYLLIKYQSKYYFLLYDPSQKSVTIPEPEFLLGLIECNPDTEKAIVDLHQIEAMSDDCLKIWCERHDYLVDDIVRECTLYLQPDVTEQTILSLLS